MDLKVDSELVDLLRDVVAESGCPDRKSLLGSQPRLWDGHEPWSRTSGRKSQLYFVASTERA